MSKRSRIAATLASIALAVSPALAQQPAPPPAGKGGDGSLELKQIAPVPPRPPIVRPEPQSKEAIGEAQKSVEELERQQREERLLRQSKPAPPARPDLEESVRGGIQSREVQKALPKQ
jgi:hypothetical protein